MALGSTGGLVPHDSANVCVYVCVCVWGGGGGAQKSANSWGSRPADRPAHLGHVDRRPASSVQCRVGGGGGGVGGFLELWVVAKGQEVKA